MNHCRPRSRPLLAAAFLLLVPTGSSIAAGDSLPLAGEWRFQLDANDVGVAERWFNRRLEDTIRLPGTTDENRKGIRKDERAVDRLSRVWFWKGPAWYQREVTIPDAWGGKRVTLVLERTKNTRLWVDDTFCGWDDTLSAPQVFDVTKAMSPGQHTITLLVDNARLPPVGPSHAVDERTQTNWNGIVGRMELRATDPVWIEDVQVFPDAARKEARVRIVIGNMTGQTAAGTVTVGDESDHGDRSGNSSTRSSLPVRVAGTEEVIEFTHLTGGEVPLWDEFDPSLLRLKLTLEATAGDKSCTDRRSIRFGMRDFKRDGHRLTINGRTVFLRGRVDCANYPLTGYAPMDKTEWLRILSIQKEWGINHVRFHSWCPPEAAFAAADELGMYLQPEIPSKRSGYKAPENQDAARHNIDRLDVESSGTEVTLYDYARREGELIFRHFGNHPSFVMFTLGNELGRNEGMFEMVAHFQETNPRCLHAQGSNNMHWNPSLAAGDEFWVTCKTSKSLPLRGAFYLHDNPNAHIENDPPSTMVDFSDSIRGIPVPVVGHETGAFQVSPDYRDIAKFTGVLRARNYETFRDRIQTAGMLDQAHDFVRASGALAAICYREDIEAALRTPGMSGFQLLDLMDFPGQGTALVGMLNVFMEDKGVIDPATWHRFCSETVPLLRMKKYTWTNDETFIGRVQVAHYGPADLPEAIVTWTVTDDNGTKLAGGSFDPGLIKTGEVSEVDIFALPLADVAAPQKLAVTLSVDGTPYLNKYPIWDYPAQVDTSPPDGVMIARILSITRFADNTPAGIMIRETLEPGSPFAMATFRGGAQACRAYCRWLFPG